MLRRTTQAMSVGKMLQIVPSTKDFAKTCTDLEESVKKNKFGVMHVHDIAETLKKKGIEGFPEQVKVFEVCNPVQASKVLAEDPSFCMALPCRIAVYTKKGQVEVGQMVPESMMAIFEPTGEQADRLKLVAKEVQASTTTMVYEAAGVPQP